MPEQFPYPLPFRVEHDAEAGRMTVWKTFGNPPRQTMRRKEIASLEALAAEVGIHRQEAFLQHSLAQPLASTAVKALSHPIGTVPVSQILRRGAMPRPEQAG